MEGGSKKNTEKENKYAGPLMASLENTLGDLMLDGEDGADSKSPNERLLQLVDQATLRAENIKQEPLSPLKEIAFPMIRGRKDGISTGGMMETEQRKMAFHPIPVKKPRIDPPPLPFVSQNPAATGTSGATMNLSKLFTVTGNGSNDAAKKKKPADELALASQGGSKGKGANGAGRTLLGEARDEAKNGEESGTERHVATIGQVHLVASELHTLMKAIKKHCELERGQYPRDISFHVRAGGWKLVLDEFKKATGKELNSDSTQRFWGKTRSSLHENYDQWAGLIQNKNPTEAQRAYVKYFLDDANRLKCSFPTPLSRGGFEARAETFENEIRGVQDLLESRVDSLTQQVSVLTQEVSVLQQKVTKGEADSEKIKKAFRDILMQLGAQGVQINFGPDKPLIDKP